MVNNMRAKTIAAKDSKKKERPKPKPMEEGPVLYVSSPIAPDTAKIYFAVVKELLEEKGCKAIVMGEPKIDFEKHDDKEARCFACKIGKLTDFG